MPYIEPTNEQTRALLEGVGTIALVGASDDPFKPSHAVMRFLVEEGFRVIPVNPRLAGQKLFGEKVIASLGEIKEPVDMVDIFRNSAEAGAVVDEAIALGARVVWMQLGVVNGAAAERALAAGLQVVMNRCPKIELAS